MSKLGGLTTRSQIGVLAAVTVGALGARLLRGRAIPAFEDDQQWNNGRPWPPLGDAPVLSSVHDTIDLTVPREVTSPGVSRSDTNSEALRSRTDLESHATVAVSVSTTWVAPADGQCPDGYPVKAKLKSGIFHRPGGLSYDRTIPDRCYVDDASAEADGLRAAKR